MREKESVNRRMEGGGGVHTLIEWIRSQHHSSSLTSRRSWDGETCENFLLSMRPCVMCSSLGRLTNEGGRLGL
jgi:hypothetical protein